jgi:hypothetical protein
LPDEFWRVDFEEDALRGCEWVASEKPKPVFLQQINNDVLSVKPMLAVGQACSFPVTILNSLKNLTVIFV